MKKLTIVLILTLGWLISNGQTKYPPIKPYMENDYSISQVKIFAKENTKLASSWRKELLILVNSGLMKSGENFTVSKEDIDWILDNVIYERKKLFSFKNSRNVLESVSFYPDKDFDGMVGVFKYGKCSLVVFKTRCINLLKVPVEIIEPFNPGSFSLQEQNVNDWEYVVPKKISGEGKLSTNFELDLYQDRDSKKIIRKKTWVGKNLGWIIPAVGVAGTSIYFLLKEKKGMTPDPRTMPPGIGIVLKL